MDRDTLTNRYFDLISRARNMSVKECKTLNQDWQNYTEEELTKAIDVMEPLFSHLPPFHEEIIQQEIESPTGTVTFTGKITSVISRTSKYDSRKGYIQICIEVSNNNNEKWITYGTCPGAILDLVDDEDDLWSRMVTITATIEHNGHFTKSKYHENTLSDKTYDFNNR